MQSYELPRSSNQLEQASCQVASPDLARVQISRLGQSLSHSSPRPASLLHPSQSPPFTGCSRPTFRDSPSVSRKYHPPDLQTRARARACPVPRLHQAQCRIPGNENRLTTNRMTEGIHRRVCGVALEPNRRAQVSEAWHSLPE